MLDINRIKASSLNNNSYEIEESKKSKGKQLLIDKIRTFRSYIKNIALYHDIIDLEQVSDNTLDNYIEFLNNKSITVGEAMIRIHEQYNENEQNVSESEADELLEQAQTELDALGKKIVNIENKLANAESEQQAREDFASMEQEELPVEEIEEVESIENDDVIPVQELVEQNLQPIEIEQQYIEAENKVREDFEKIEQEQYKMISEEKELTEIVMPKYTDPEEKIMNDIQDEYKQNVSRIEDNYKENFGREFSGIVNAIMIETEKYASRQVEEIAVASKQAIEKANSNTQKVLDEKAIVENDRDQYKSHYEQTLETVQQKNAVIDSKDEEIKVLESKIETKDNELSNKNSEIQSLNMTLNERNNYIATLESKISNYKVTLATLTKELGRNFQYGIEQEQIEEEISMTK